MSGFSIGGETVRQTNAQPRGADNSPCPESGSSICLLLIWLIVYYRPVFVSHWLASAINAETVVGKKLPFWRTRCYVSKNSPFDVLIRLINRSA